MCGLQKFVFDIIFIVCSWKKFLTTFFYESTNTSVILDVQWPQQFTILYFSMNIKWNYINPRFGWQSSQN